MPDPVLRLTLLRGTGIRYSHDEVPNHFEKTGEE